jgi:hypothetical protein
VNKLKLVGGSSMESVNQAMAAAGGGAASYSGGKILTAAGAGLTLASIVVMVMTNPASKKHFMVMLICTAISSICGGAAVIQYFGLQSWGNSFYGLTALIGISFTCGLPAWVFVRSAFIWSERNKSKGLPDLLKEVRDSVK